MTLLGIETSCDETSAAVIRDGVILANTVSSQIKLHAEYGGVVPELATREHLKNLIPVVRSALSQAGVGIDELQAVAATRGPGLPSALFVGFQAAQALAFSRELPLYGIHHHEAHLFSPWITGNQSSFADFQPNVSLIVSGGHTLIVRVNSLLDFTVIGGTVDDAAGECFDKVAKLIGLPYPGGPEMDRLARQGNPLAHAFPRPMLHEPHFDFSFSGLKTSVRYYIRDHPEILEDTQKIRDLCASVQAAIVEVLVAKVFRAAKSSGFTCITASGGVTCNSGLREKLQSTAKARGMVLRLAEKTFCTDNAAMVAILAEQKIKAGIAPTPFQTEVIPGWSLPSVTA